MVRVWWGGVGSWSQKHTQKEESVRDTEKEAWTGQGEAQSAILNFLPPDFKTIHFCYLSKKKKEKNKAESPAPLPTLHQKPWQPG